MTLSPPALLQNSPPNSYYIPTIRWLNLQSQQGSSLELLNLFTHEQRNFSIALHSFITYIVNILYQRHISPFIAHFFLTGEHTQKIYKVAFLKV